MLKRNLVILLALSFFLLGSFISTTNVYADEDGDNQDEIEDLQEKIEEYEEKIDELQETEQSLQRDIDYSNSQISITQLRIDQSLAQISKKENEITKLAGDISDLKLRIDKLINSISVQEELLNERMRARYKSKDASPMVVIFGSDTLNSIIQKSEYLKVLQRQDKKMLDAMNNTKEAYDVQKSLFEDKKAQEEELKYQLESEKQNLEVYRGDLNRQKGDQETLLEQTQNDEAKYQNLLAQVQSELAALQFALNLPAGEGEDVEEGDVIGFMGNTGCSSGPHLHFGYVKDGKAVDPLPYINSGDLKWPVDNPVITQNFGENYTFYMNNFGIPGHDAIDIAVAGCPGCGGAPVKAARDGKVYYTQDSKVYCPWLNNSLGKGAIIDHGDGKKTIYWHLQ